jgi:EAL domain-containing protein (putative c-di-GMP-specific phosphodiesterase class I)
VFHFSSSSAVGFIAAPERYGITPAIDRWAIENAPRWLVSEADESEKLMMCSINLSGQSRGHELGLRSRAWAQPQRVLKSAG